MYFQFFKQSFPKAGTKIYDSAGNEWGRIKGGIASPLTQDMLAYVVGTVVVPASALKIGNKITLVDGTNPESFEKFGSDHYVEIDHATRHLNADGYNGPLYLKMPAMTFPNPQVSYKETAEALVVPGTNIRVEISLTPNTFVNGGDGVGYRLEGVLVAEAENGAAFLCLRAYGDKTLSPMMNIVPAKWVTRIANQCLYLAAGNGEIERLPKMKKPVQIAVGR